MNEIKHHLTKLRQLLSITDVNLYGVTITMSDKFIIRITFFCSAQCCATCESMRVPLLAVRASVCHYVIKSV